MTKEHIRRINIAIEYINNNIDQELNLAIIAKIALYSPFHFHRLFTSLTGESPNKYILRIRIERSALLIKKNRNLSMSEIAAHNGFVSNSSFSKAFKKHYGISPTDLKNNSHQFSKIRQINSKNGQDRIEISNDICDVNHLKHVTSTSSIAIKNIKDIRVAYVSHVGAFNQIGEAYSTLLSWAKKNNLSNVKRITRFYDSPEVTDLSQIRQSACVEIPHSFEASNDMSFSIVEGGKHAVGKFEIEKKNFDKAWQIMILWVSEHGYLPHEKKTCFEIYHNHFSNVPSEKNTIEIFVPIRTQTK